jgi:hypothetical protein
MTPLPRKDYFILAMLGFFVVMAFTMELWWLLHADRLVALAETDWLARLFSYYGEGDSAYFDRVTPFSRGLESINIFFTQGLNLWLMYAIVRRRPYRHALQLTVGSYLTYSVVLYFWAAHLSGYAGMREKTFFAAFIFVVPNLPWLLGYFYLAFDSIRAINEQFRRDPRARSAGAEGTALARASGSGELDPVLHAAEAPWSR